MQALRARCLEKRVKLIGDIPIFVAHDSADVWSRPDLFFLDKRGQPTVQAGVPPDLFSTTGQLWGNPLYRWEAHQKEGFSWWIGRIERASEMGRPDSHRSFPRLRGLLGGAGQGEDRGQGTLGACAG